MLFGSMVLRFSRFLFLFLIFSLFFYNVKIHKWMSKNDVNHYPYALSFTKKWLHKRMSELHPRSHLICERIRKFSLTDLATSSSQDLIMGVYSFFISDCVLNKKMKCITEYRKISVRQKGEGVNRLNQAESWISTYSSGLRCLTKDVSFSFF